MDRKGAISGTKGTVIGRKGFGMVKGRCLGREGSHFFFVGRTSKRTKRALLWKERVHRHWTKRHFCSEGRHICFRASPQPGKKKSGRKGSISGRKSAVTDGKGAVVEGRALSLA